jgi:predicted ABC-type ATPase
VTATGARRGNLVYHWKHGWIPLDHHAALSKAKGSKLGAAKIEKKHGIEHKPSAPIHPDTVKDLRGGSADKHLITDSTGQTRFSPERQALHDKIIQQIVGGHKSHANPAFVMLGGGPASGKTKAAEAAAHDFPGAVTINPDDIKMMLPEYKQLGPDKAAAFTHEESSYLTKQANAAAIAQRSHIILDAVGDNSVKSVEGKVSAAHAAGYSTHARYVTVPTHVAQARAVSRGVRSGRVVPPSVIEHAHAGVSEVFPQVMGKFDTASLHDNSTDWKPVLSMTRGQAPKIHDPAAYHAFLSKAKAKP